jgi:ribose 5-phosphate isomerase B
MKIIIGSDHRGLNLKEEIKTFLLKESLLLHDVGPFDDKPVDYPDLAKEVAEKVSSGTYDRGILICGSGIGMSIVANKFPRVRAALCKDSYCAQMSRKHNDANVLILGADTTPPGEALTIVDTWIKCEFEGGRHQQRLDKIKEIENAQFKRG